MRVQQLVERLREVALREERAVARAVALRQQERVKLGQRRGDRHEPVLIKLIARLAKLRAVHDAVAQLLAQRRHDGQRVRVIGPPLLERERARGEVVVQPAVMRGIVVEKELGRA